LSINWQLDGDPAPAILVLPPAAASLDEAEAAIELWEFYKRRKLDAAQRLTVQVMMATRGDGLWAAPTTGREESRQNGKGDEIEVVELWDLVQRAARVLHTVHDAVLLATEAQSRLISVIEGHADLRRKMQRAWRGTGQQMIEMRNGGIIWYRTRTGGGGRGVDEVDRIVVDEAQHAEEEHLAAITPTQLASANPQLNAMGSAGIEGKSRWWWRLRKRALSSEPGDLGYVGHTAEDVSLGPDGRVRRAAVDATDRRLLHRANPALGAGRVSEAFFDEQLRRLGEALFAREHLGVWDAEPDEGGGPIDPARWESLTDADSLPADSTVRLALDAPPDRKSATFSTAGKRTDNLLHVQVSYHEPLAKESSPLKDRVVALALQLTKGHNTSLILPPSSPARAWKADLLAAAVPLDEMTPAEYAEACGRIANAIDEGTLRHRGQPEMNNAVAGLASKASGDVEAWSRRSSSSNIAPFVAATCALARVPVVVGGEWAGSFTDLDEFAEE
jgi:hypothetical protein